MGRVFLKIKIKPQVTDHCDDAIRTASNKMPIPFHLKGLRGVMQPDYSKEVNMKGGLNRLTEALSITYIGTDVSKSI